MPGLAGTSFEPCELWDKNGDGQKVKLPDISKLTAEDLILVFPKSSSAIYEIAAELEGCPAKTLLSDGIEILIAQIHFPQLETLVREYSESKNTSDFGCERSEHSYAR
jgi:hypothetical protein